MRLIALALRGLIWAYWAVVLLVASAFAAVLWLGIRPFFGSARPRRRGVQTSATHADPGDENDWRPRRSAAATWDFPTALDPARGVEEVRLMPAAARIQPTIHLAGDPHEGTQACRYCGAVLVEEDEHTMVLEGPRRDQPFFPAGAHVTVGHGWRFVGAEPGALPCRPASVVDA